jgi:ligand-binding sensor domain-containing protein
MPHPQIHTLPRLFRTFTMLCMLVLSCLMAGAQQYNFRNFSVAEGLAQSQVYAICEDSRGNLWLGTRGGGVSRFDGQTFTSFTEEDGLVSNYLRTIIEDKQGNLWFGTDEGVSKYDGRKFTNYTEKDGLCSNLVNAVLQDNSGNYWFGTDDEGLSRFDGKKFTTFSDKDGLPNKKIFCLFLDNKTGMIWAGTEVGASRFDPANLTVKKAFTTYTVRSGLAGNTIRSIINDDRGNLWFGTYGGGITRYDGKTWKTYTVSDGLCNNTVHCLLNAGNGKLWIGTAIGVSRFDGEDFTTFTELEGLCNNVIMCVAKDSWGNTWFGSSGGGVSRYDNERFVHFNEKSGKMGTWVYALHQDKQGNMWFCTSSGGVTRYDGTYYTHYTANDGFTDGKVKCIHEDSLGRLWFGTIGEGAYVFDSNGFAHFGRKEGLSGNFVNDISSDSFGNIWFATSGGGLCRYNEPAREFTRYSLKEGLSSNRIFVLFNDRKGNIWAGTSGKGISKIILPSNNDSTIKIVNYPCKKDLGSNTIRSILADDKGTLFFASAGGGVLRYDGKDFSAITKKNGISSNNIYSFVLDNGNNLWIGTEKGLDKIIFGDGYAIAGIRHYGKPEGFVGIETSQNAAMRDSAGDLWFGTIYGATKYNPIEDRPNRTPPKTQITGIRLFFNRIEQTPYGDSLSAWYPIPAKLVLPYSQNHLSFDFVGISLRNPESVRYSWKLEGFDDQWSPPSLQRDAVYSNLPPGNYTFQVKACNEDGVWNAAPQSFAFTITPPVWETWWFRITAAALLVLLLWLGLYLRVRQVKRKNRVRLEKVELEKNILELEQKSLRLQMNPHFIFNSLNSIQGFITQNDTAQAKWYLSKFAKLMRQILEHSRETYIPLSNEVSLLQNYLALERLVLNEQLDFSIIADDSIDPEIVAIPPMIVQPYVENALRHGLAHKTGKGTITLRFSIDNDLLKCEVTDNGVGREKAALLKQTTGPEKHKSTAMAVTSERLERLTKETSANARIAITDLYNDDREPAGTRVDIYMPFVMLN